MKPNIVRDYNDGMSGIDRTDQMLSYHSSLRKTERWYKKVGIHIFEIFLVNSFHLYNQTKPKKDHLRIMDFREKLVSNLVGELPASLHMRPQTHFHYMVAHPPTKSKDKPTKPCRVCTSQKVRRESRYCCATCNGRPSLCVDPCFLVYHEQLGIATAAPQEDDTDNSE